jgi:hypothetical protein
VSIFELCHPRPIPCAREETNEGKIQLLRASPQLLLTLVVEEIEKAIVLGFSSRQRHERIKNMDGLSFVQIAGLADREQIGR